MRAAAARSEPKAKRATGVIVVGPTPPPNHGVTIMTRYLVDAVERAGLLAAHLDTADRRPIDSVGRLDLTNVRLALAHALRLLALLIRHPGAAVYVPVSQGRWGLLRDAVLLSLARVARRARIVHLHGGRFAAFRAESGPVVRFAIRVAIGGADQAWVLTESLRGAFGDLIAAERVHTLANCVEDNPAARSGGTEEGALTILCLANFLPEKGQGDLLDALALLGAPDRPLAVRLVGEATAEVSAAIEARAAELAAAGIEVTLVGAVEAQAKRAELAGADVFVCPSRDEGQPLVILEAMAAGLPIVATGVGGIPDTVEAERSAIVVAPSEPRALAAALERLISDPALRMRLGAAARSGYESSYRPSVFTERVASLLSQLMPIPAGRRSTPEGPAGT